MVERKRVGCPAKSYRVFCKYFFPILAFCFLSSWAGYAETNDAKRGIHLGDLLSIRDIKAMVVSPDGNYVAYQVVQADKDRNDYNVSWHVTATEPGAPSIMLADGGEAFLGTISTGTTVGDDVAPSEIFWSVDSNWIYFTQQKDGAVQLWRSHRGRQGAEQLTNNAADVEGPKASADGSKLFFVVGRDRAEIAVANQREAQRGYLVQDPPIYTVEAGPLWPPCTDGQTRWRRQVGKDRACTLAVWTFDIQSEVERRATQEEVDEYYGTVDSSLNARLRRGQLKHQAKSMEISSPDGKRQAWFENENPDAFKGYVPPMRVAASNGDKTLRCLADACKSERPEGLWWSVDGKEVTFLVRNGPRHTLSSLYAWTPGDADVRTILRTDDMFYDCELSVGHLICGHESWTSPRKIVSVDLLSGEISTIVNMNPDFKNFSFTKVEKVFGEDDYGNPAHAHLVYPKDYIKGQRYPLVIVQYRSRGFLRGGTGDEHPIHVLAQNGFAVLSFDSPEGDYFTKSADMLENQIAYLKYVMIEHGPATAIENMVDALDKRGIIDPTRIGITGLSHGAITVDTALLSRNYAAASTAYSYMAPPNLNRPSSSYWGQAMDGAFGGTPFSTAGFETRAKHSVGLNAHKVDTPYLIQVADREYYMTIQNYNALKNAGKPVEMYVFPDEYHVKWQPAHRYAVYQRNMDWFNFWLRDVEGDDPDKMEQYKRWRQIRERHHANLKEVILDR